MKKRTLYEFDSNSDQNEIQYSDSTEKRTSLWNTQPNVVSSGISNQENRVAVNNNNNNNLPLIQPALAPLRIVNPRGVLESMLRYLPVKFIGYIRLDDGKYQPQVHNSSIIFPHKTHVEIHNLKGFEKFIKTYSHMLNTSLYTQVANTFEVCKKIPCVSKNGEHHWVAEKTVELRDFLKEQSLFIVLNRYPELRATLVQLSSAYFQERLPTFTTSNNVQLGSFGWIPSEVLVPPANMITKYFRTIQAEQGNDLNLVQQI